LLVSNAAMFKNELKSYPSIEFPFTRCLLQIKGEVKKLIKVRKSRDRFCLKKANAIQKGQLWNRQKPYLCEQKDFHKGFRELRRATQVNLNLSATARRPMNMPPAPCVSHTFRCDGPALCRRKRNPTRARASCRAGRTSSSGRVPPPSASPAFVCVQEPLVSPRSPHPSHRQCKGNCVVYTSGVGNALLIGFNR